MLGRLLTIVLILFFVLGAYVAVTAVTLPNVRRALETGVEPSQTSQIFGRDGTLIMAYGKFQHKPVRLSEIPKPLIDALIATEDRRFYQHKGIDPIGIARALVRNIRSQGVHEGGSTLTQQLARNIFLSNERSFERKVKEALLAIKLEQQLTKDQILELYLNNIYFGEGAYGIGAASNIYFGRRPGQLTQAECALLAGLPQAPSLYSPFSNPDLAVRRRNEVIDNMVENGTITQSQAGQMKRARVHLNPNGRALSTADKAPYFNRYVIQQVLSRLGMDEQTFWQQGIKIYTTLDPRAQVLAENQVRATSHAYGRTGRNQQAALLSLDNKGGILAYVGGKDFSASQFDRVTQAHRLAGSLFKVFVYTTAIEHGYSPLTVYRDEPVEFGNWKPENYDKSHHGYMTLAQALVQSNNIVAAKLLNDLGPDAVIQTARRMGIQSSLGPNLSLALGAADVTLKEMTAAFSVFSNNGVYIEPYAIEKIVDRDGRVLYQHAPRQRGVLQRPARDTMVRLMEGVIKYGTGRGAAIGRPAAGKTGTSDEYRDAWFIGYTPEVTTGVWVGNDDNSQMPGVTGGSIPARIWRGYMTRLMSGMPMRHFEVSAALPLEDKDFFVYNLDHLSASEDRDRAEQEQSGDVQAQTPENPEGEYYGDNPETFSFVDNTMRPAHPVQPGQELVPGQEPPPGWMDEASQGQQSQPHQMQSPQPPPPGQGRFVDTHPQPRSQRFMMPANPSQNRHQPYVPEQGLPGRSSGGGARPIVDPLGTANPGTQPQKPENRATTYP